MTRENSGVAPAKFRNTASYKIKWRQDYIELKYLKKKPRIFGSPMLLVAVLFRHCNLLRKDLKFKLTKMKCCLNKTSYTRDCQGLQRVKY